MDRRKAGLAAGMVLVLTLGGSGALAASSQRDPADDPCAKTAACTPAGEPCAKDAACTPADIAKAKAAKAAELDGKCSPDVKRPDKKQEQPKLVENGMLAKALAASLGVGLDRATAAEEELNLLSQKGGINPKSPEFAAIAERLGVSPERLIQALDDFKRSFVRGEDVKPDAGKTPGS
ncbi:hypothetical protein [Nonomuraea jabiensis]|uniref:UDP-N-acetylmuramyl pentapeptide synthase n=1 Tax=Nonomuraea jabiensis TaxID=882448 RepID=A0A7W9G8F9_9ACTN|nr:hypothetical protein [Nonomuraea jabiensis]MBB5779062.1 UDP-N-acetylmuramyl pentapeptide synthase [Nonomuraea jabiensis]